MIKSPSVQSEEGPVCTNFTGKRKLQLHRKDEAKIFCHVCNDGKSRQVTCALRNVWGGKATVVLKIVAIGGLR